MRRKGFTIVELLVAIALFSILVTIGVGGFVNALHTQRQVAGLLAAESNASVTLEQMAREIRTGDLFCHDADSTTPSPACGCTVTRSNYADATAPVVVNDPTLLGNLPVWTCSALTYGNGTGQTISYALQNGVVMRTVNGDTQAITGDNVAVKYLTFTLFGNTEGDNWTPRITIGIGIAPNSTDPALINNVLNLETTISARNIDCTQSGVTQC